MPPLLRGQVKVTDTIHAKDIAIARAWAKQNAAAIRKDEPIREALRMMYDPDGFEENIKKFTERMVKAAQVYEKSSKKDDVLDQLLNNFVPSKEAMAGLNKHARKVSGIIAEPTQNGNGPVLSNPETKKWPSGIVRQIKYAATQLPKKPEDLTSAQGYFVCAVRELQDDMNAQAKTKKSTPIDVYQLGSKLTHLECFLRKAQKRARTDQVDRDSKRVRVMFTELNRHVMDAQKGYAQFFEKFDKLREVESVVRKKCLEVRTDREKKMKKILRQETDMTIP